MGSLFNNNGSCCGNTAGTTQTKSKCGGCVCELLNQLANATAGNFCTMGQQNVVRIIPKGANEPLDLTQGGAPGTGTDFTLVKFDPETCCAVFTFREGQGANALVRTIVLDCRCICGIVCVQQDTRGPGLG